MSALPNCPSCDSAYTYQDGLMLVCPECGHEWAEKILAEKEEPVQSPAEQ